MRTYNPTLGETLESWGIMALPTQYERERRWLNMYRKHDLLRSLSDEEYERLVDYVDSATRLVLDVMRKEKEAAAAPAKAAKPKKPRSPGKPGVARARVKRKAGTDSRARAKAGPGNSRSA